MPSCVSALSRCTRHRRRRRRRKRESPCTSGSYKGRRWAQAAGARRPQPSRPRPPPSRRRRTCATGWNRAQGVSRHAGMQVGRAGGSRREFARQETHVGQNQSPSGTCASGGVMQYVWYARPQPSLSHMSMRSPSSPLLQTSQRSSASLPSPSPSSSIAGAPLRADQIGASVPWYAYAVKLAPTPIACSRARSRWACSVGSCGSSRASSARTLNAQPPAPVRAQCHVPVRPCHTAAQSHRQTGVRRHGGGICSKAHPSSSAHHQRWNLHMAAWPQKHRGGAAGGGRMDGTVYNGSSAWCERPTRVSLCVVACTSHGAAATIGATPVPFRQVCRR